jgi:GNAT superfamily N-acetyltransferase
VNIASLPPERIGEVQQLMGLGEPFIRARTLSDYWLYATLFSSTCPVSIADDNTVAGALIAVRSQDEPADVYIQDVMIHPRHRRRGIARALLERVRSQAETWNCRRLYLTSEPDNQAAHTSWIALGFANVAGDHEIDGVSVVTDFKGPGRSRAVYQLTLS